MAGSLRLFVALEVPEAVQQGIAAAWAPLRSQERGVAWADPKGLHLTLKFLGEVEERRLPLLETALARAARGSRPLRLQVQGVGAFPSLSSPRVLWVGVIGDREALAALQERVEEELVPLGFPREGHPFTPHITVGRVRAALSPAERRRLGEAAGRVVLPRDLSFEVSRLTLMHSTLTPQGARYRPLHAWPLAQGAHP
jgi:2'-5' RNA ligase